MIPEVDTLATRRPAPDPARLRATVRGLQLVYYGILLRGIASVAFVAAVAIGVFAGASSTSALSQICVCSALILKLISVLAVFIGEVRCVRTPPAARATGLITVCVILDITNALVVIMIALLMTVAMQVEHAQLTSTGLQIGLCVLVTCHTLCFVVFLKRLGDFVSRQDLSRRSGTLIVFHVGLACGWIGMGVMTAALLSRGHPLSLAIFVAYGVLAIFACVVWGLFLLLIHDVAMAVRNVDDISQSNSE